MDVDGLTGFVGGCACGADRSWVCVGGYSSVGSRSAATGRHKQPAPSTGHCGYPGKASRCHLAGSAASPAPQVIQPALLGRETPSPTTGPGFMKGCGPAAWSPHSPCLPLGHLTAPFWPTTRYPPLHRQAGRQTDTEQHPSFCWWARPGCQLPDAASKWAANSRPHHNKPHHSAAAFSRVCKDPNSRAQAICIVVLVIHVRQPVSSCSSK